VNKLPPKKETFIPVGKKSPNFSQKPYKPH